MLQKLIRWEHAYDKRDPDPSKNYGIRGMGLVFMLKGKEGVIQFVIFTDWHIASVRAETRVGKNFGPLPADVGFHCYTQQYGAEYHSKSCSVLEDKECFYEGSSLAADDVFNVFTEKGEHAMWTELLNRYNAYFNTQYDVISTTILSLSE